MLEVWLSTLIILVLLGILILLANLAERDFIKRNFAERDKTLYRLTIVGIVVLNALILLNSLSQLGISLLPADQQGSNPPLEVRNTLPSFIVTILTVLLATLLLSERFRSWIAPLFPRPVAISPEPPAAIPTPQPPVSDNIVDLIGNQIRAIFNKPSELLGFRPDSLIHALAAILVVHFFGSQFATFFSAGGLDGLAEDIQIDYSTLIANFLPMLIIPFMGVGIFIRRDFRASMGRLGLERVSWKELVIAVVTSFGLLCALFIIASCWILVVSAETYEEQNKASSALADSITTVGLAFTVAATAAIGEEILFRGALQPIFGLWTTAFLFTIIHIQYTLTPATLIILVVAVVLGYVRRYFNTTTAIVIHFLYNLIQLLIAVAASQASWLPFFR